jgi:hypothetical protein
MQIHMKLIAFSAALLISGSMLSRPAVARSTGPFARFSGEWRGAGHVQSNDGRSDPITCRARYEVSGGGMALSQSLVCASDSYRFDIHCDVIADGQVVSGRWQETTRNVSGNLTGQIDTGVFDGNVEGPGFTAAVSMRTNGRKQAVEISPHAGDISKVSVIMPHNLFSVKWYFLMEKEAAADLVPSLVIACGQRSPGPLRGLSQSAFSQTMRGPEARLGVRQLKRTTRRVSRPRPATSCCATSDPALRNSTRS